MKKSVFSLIIATGIALLLSCSSSNTIPLERQLGIQEPVKLETYADLNLMISQKQSFLLTTYSSTCFCSNHLSCSYFFCFFFFFFNDPPTTDSSPLPLPASLRFWGIWCYRVCSYHLVCRLPLEKQKHMWQSSSTHENKNW